MYVGAGDIHNLWAYPAYENFQVFPMGYAGTKLILHLIISTADNVASLRYCMVYWIKCVMGQGEEVCGEEAYV